MGKRTSVVIAAGVALVAITAIALFTIPTEKGGKSLPDLRAARADAWQAVRAKCEEGLDKSAPAYSARLASCTDEADATLK